MSNDHETRHRLQVIRKTVRRRTWTGILATGLATLGMVLAVYFQQRAILIESHLLQQDRLLTELEGTFGQLQERQMRTASLMAHVVRNFSEGSVVRSRSWSLLSADSSIGHLAQVRADGAKLLWARGGHKPWLAREFYSERGGLSVSDLEAPPPGRDSSWDAVLSVRVKSVLPGQDLELAATGHSLRTVVEPFLLNRGVSLSVVNNKGNWFPLYDRDSGGLEPRDATPLSKDVFAELAAEPRGILWTGHVRPGPLATGSLVHARKIKAWGNLEWILVLHVPRREITAPLIAQFGRTGFLLGILGLLWVAMAWILIKRDLRLSRLEEDIEHLRQMRRKDEQLVQAEKLSSIGVLVSGLAHEIGTPLGVVSMRLQLMRRRTPDDSEDRKTLDIALGQLDRVTGLIRQLLDFARSKPGQEQPIDVAAAVRTVRDLVTPLVQRRSAALDLEVPEGLPRINGSPDGVQQIVLNLVMNALQAIGDGGRVVVAARQDDDRICLTVDDDGPGIPEGFRASVFDPFYTTKRIGEGTGLGLTVVLGLARQMDAALAVAESPFGGARFEIRFKLWRQ
jgi:signal transduction histidine kinase